MKKLFLLFLILISIELNAQSLPVVTEPPSLVLYNFHPNLVQLRVEKDDYNEYILVNDSCEVELYDKAGVRLAPNNFIIYIPFNFREDSIHFRLFNRSNLQHELGVISFDISNPPVEEIFLDGIPEGGTCSRRPLKIEARTPEEAPIPLIYHIEYWTMEIGDKHVFGKDGKFDEYAYSVLSEFPAGTEVKFKLWILQERGYSTFFTAIFYLE